MHHHDGRPQPASRPLTEQEARKLADRTRGQLVAYRGDDGNWYVTQPAATRRGRP